MIKNIVMSALVALGMTTPVMAADAGLQKVLDSTIRLNENCSGQIVYSDRNKESGEVKTIILTAKHCVEGNDSDLFVELPKYKDNRVVKYDKYLARVKGRSFKDDLAVLELKDKDAFFANTVKVAPNKPAISLGDPVVTVGYPMGRSLTITEGLFGNIETLDAFKAGAEYYRATPDIFGGSSGGGLYHKLGDGSYELLGVTCCGFRMVSFINYYTRSEEINDYLKIIVPELYKNED